MVYPFPVFSAPCQDHLCLQSRNLNICVFQDLGRKEGFIVELCCLLDNQAINRIASKKLFYWEGAIVAFWRVESCEEINRFP